MVSSRVEDEMGLMKEKVVVRFSSDDKQQTKPAHPPAKRGGGMMLSRVDGGSSGSSKVFSEDHLLWEKGILDPGSKLMINWNRVFLMACLLTLFVDPLFFYVPSVRERSGIKNAQCIQTDYKLSIIITLFRTLADIFYILHIVLKFRTAYVAPSSRVFGRGELVMNRRKIARRYLRSAFFVDLAAALPLSQIVIWAIIPAFRNPIADYNNNALAMILLFQYVLRLYLMFPLSNQMIKTNGVLTKTAWAGAAYNLLLYMLASHVLGAMWYLISIDRQATCWKSKCHNDQICQAKFLSCRYKNGSDDDLKHWAEKQKLDVFTKCNGSSSDDSDQFQFGIFGVALTKKVVSSSFIRKYFYCLWWGLQQLSSYGQNLSTTAYMGETSFAILIAILGLVLFAHLIGNMQRYLQSTTLRLEEWRLKRRDTEEWMRHRQLPHDLRNRVRKFLQYKWLATQGVDEESILQSLPSDLRRDIQRHLCLDLVRRVRLFSQMDDQLLDAICERLVSSLSTEGTYIVREGDPVVEMLFIIRGRLESSTTNGGRTGFFNSNTLRPGDFCGEELLAWALLPRSSANLPSSTRTVKALTEVEAFALHAEDLRFVSNQFRRLHSKKLQQTFRFYSHHWRTWAACFIQAAWQRYKRRKLAKYLNTYDSFSSQQSDEQVGETSQDENYEFCSSTAMVLSSKVSGSRRGAQKVDIGKSRLQKPDEPDFSADQYN